MSVENYQVDSLSIPFEDVLTTGAGSLDVTGLLVWLGVETAVVDAAAPPSPIPKRLAAAAPRELNPFSILDKGSSPW